MNTVTYLKNIFKPEEFSSVTLNEALESIKDGTFRENIKELRENSDDEKVEKMLKNNLPAYSFNGTFKGSVKNDFFLSSSGLFYFDIDSLGANDIETHKTKIAAISSCVFCFVSPRGNGLKGALKIDPAIVTDDASFKLVYAQGEKFFKKMGYTIDSSRKDVRGLCFASYDPNIYINNSASIFEIKKEPEKPKTNNVYQFSNNCEDECIKRVMAFFINVPQGKRHESRLSASILAGGFIAGGLLNEDKIMSLLDSMSDGIADGGSATKGERKTLIDGVKIGKLKPIYSINYKKENIIKPLVWGTPAYKIIPNIIDDINKLPSLPEEFKKLPYGLGLIQDYIYNRMMIPSRELAAISALSVMSHFSQKNTIIDSFSGLTCNEFYMILGGTATGKDEVRRSFKAIIEATEKDATERDSLFNSTMRSNVSMSAPASKQGLHKIMESNNATTFVSDEFGEWLKDTANSSHKQQALGYLMEIYTSGLSTVIPGNAVSNDYKPVTNPRITLVTTSTSEKIIDGMTATQADSGAYNRFITYIMDDAIIPTRYSGQVYEVPKEVINLLAYVQCSNKERIVKFSKEAWLEYQAINEGTARPLKAIDGVLAGRLSEQAIRISTYICLSDRREEISVSDLQLAYKLRFGLYHRIAALIQNDDVLSKSHETSKAYDQLKRAFMKKEFIYVSRFDSLSISYSKLSVQEKDIVINMLIKNEVISRKGKICYSLVFEV